MNTFTKAGANVRTAADNAREQVNRSLVRSRDRVEMQVHRHPAESILLVAASGIVVGTGVGFLLGWRTRGNGHRNGRG